MINIEDISKEGPFEIFRQHFTLALKNKQSFIDACAISSFNTSTKEINSRFVNIKYIKNNEFIFFSNYNSPKAVEFSLHDQITALFFWNKTNTQIRIKAKIEKTNSKFSDFHFNKRSPKKNALAISSLQSKPIYTYNEVLKEYNIVLSNKKLLSVRPEYWGGYSFKPYYFEFWEGHDLRLNERNVYKAIGNKWEHILLQP